MSADLEARIATLHAWRRLVTWTVVIVGGMCLGLVVATTLTADAYSTLGLTLWCSLPLVAVALHALLVIVVRDRLTAEIQRLEAVGS